MEWWGRPPSWLTNLETLNRGNRVLEASLPLHAGALGKGQERRKVVNECPELGKRHWREEGAGAGLPKWAGLGRGLGPWGRRGQGQQGRALGAVHWAVIGGSGTGRLAMGCWRKNRD